MLHKKYSLYILGWLSLVLAACQSSGEETQQDDIPHRHSQTTIRYNQLKLDTLLLKPELFSGNGFMHLSEADSLYYFDKIFGTVFVFDLKGKYYGRHLRIGEAPNEVKGIDSYTETPQGHLIMHDWTFYHFDKNWQLLKKQVIDYNTKKSQKELLENPQAADFGIYEVEYKDNQLQIIEGGKSLLINVVSEHPLFNAYANSEFYQEARIIAKLDLKNTKVVELLGRRPKSYQSYTFLPHYIYFNYDWEEKTKQFYITFNPDSLIYVYDDKLQPNYTFGVAGKDMDTKYIARKGVKLAYEEELYYEDRIRKGYYHHIKHFEELALTFRVYTQGSNSPEAFTEEDNPKRMQIYKGENLIGDCAVPKHFRLLAYRAPYFYAEGLFDEEQEVLGVYRFRLD